jgi:quinolinate synthase
MEYVAAGDVDAENTPMLSTGGMLTHARESDADTFIVATETGIIHRMQQAAPDKRFVPADRAAECAYMKTITLLDVRDALSKGQFVIDVPEEIRARALGAIERMVALGA